MSDNKEMQIMLELEQELAELTPLVRRSLATAGPPSARVETAIRREARRAIRARRGRAVPWLRAQVVVMAASLVLMLGGAIIMLLEPYRKASPAGAPHSLMSADDSTLAQLLLEIQGQYTDAYVKAEEEEVLWL